VLVACLAAGESGCAPAPPAPQAKGAGNRDTGYSAMVAQLTALDRKAEALFQAHKPDDAAALIERGELLAKQLLAVPKPSLEATEAASDLDDLYARMLLSNRHYGWARLLFQKNLARWRHWEPRTPETDLRVKRAQDAIAECDRLL
jgi:hypothetical protein